MIGHRVSGGGELAFAGIRTCIKATAMKSEWCWSRNRDVDPMKSRQARNTALHQKRGNEGTAMQ